MTNSFLKLYLEISNLSYFFYVGKYDENENFKVLYKLEIPLKGIENNRITDLEKVSDIIKKNVYIIEQKFGYTFKEIVLILENFELTCISITGLKKLNGSQILRENITYILNTLKSCVDENEHKKTILHIFNSKFYIDNKKVENLPIGLFGDLYTHELSFILINKNDYKNLKSVFEKCNLNIKKILVKSFVEGVNISENDKSSDTFFQLKINKKNSKIFYFENNSLKYEQIFKFGTDIIVKDISKIISLNNDVVEVLLGQTKLTKDILEDELFEKKFFNNNNYRKIRKRLVYDIALARIKEIFDLMFFKNINLNYNKKLSKNIFLEICDKSHLQTFQELYENTFNNNNYSYMNFKDNLSSDRMLNSVNKLINFGWKKEAIPTSQFKKSLIARFFDYFFG